MADLRGWFLKLDRWHMRLVPETDAEIDKAVETLRQRLGITNAIPRLGATKLLTPFFEHGWCLAAVEHAVRYRPSGRRQPSFTDLGDTSAERQRTLGWLLERQLAKWADKFGTPTPPPVEAQPVEDAYRVVQAVREHHRTAAVPDEAAHAARRKAVGAMRGQEVRRHARRAPDRVAAARESDRKMRAAMGELASLAGMHRSENVREIPPPQWRNEAHRRQQESQVVGAARSGYLDTIDRLRAASAASTPELAKVIAGKWRDARTEAALAYLDLLIQDAG